MILLKNPKKRKEVKQLLEGIFYVINLDNNILLQYCEVYNRLKSKGKLIPELDFFTAATALAYDLELWTKDRDFLEIKEKFPELKLRILDL